MLQADGGLTNEVAGLSGLEHALLRDVTRAILGPVVTLADGIDSEP